MEKIIEKNDEGMICLTLSREIYDEKVVLLTSYKFLENTYIKVQPTSPTSIKVYFKPKDKDKKLDEAIVDIFCNELIDQQVRKEVESKYGTIRDAIVKHAFSPIND